MKIYFLTNIIRLSLLLLLLFLEEEEHLLQVFLFQTFESNLIK